MLVVAVDDDPFALQTVQRLLGEEYDVRTASSAVEAMFALGELENVGAVLCDMNLGPGVSGLWILEQVRERNGDTHRILMSGKPSESIAGLAAALDSGAVQTFIAKNDLGARLKLALPRPSNVMPLP